MKLPRVGCRTKKDENFYNRSETKAHPLHLVSDGPSLLHYAMTVCYSRAYRDIMRGR